MKEVMNKINYIIGDVTEPIGDGMKFIAHSANNIGAWGSGVVLSISRRWSMPELMYRKWAQERPLEMKNSLGSIQVIPVEKDIFVVNIIGQEGIGKNNGIPPVRYEAIKEGLIKLKTIVKSYKNPTLHLPRIGAGLGFGNWEIIEKIIEDTVEIPVTVYTLPHEAKKYGM